MSISHCHRCHHEDNMALHCKTKHNERPTRMNGRRLPSKAVLVFVVAIINWKSPSSNKYKGQCAFSQAHPTNRKLEAPTLRPPFANTTSASSTDNERCRTQKNYSQSTTPKRKCSRKRLPLKWKKKLELPSSSSFLSSFPES